MSYVKKLYKRGLITPPKHVIDSIQLEVETGSVAYGVSADHSDVDICGFSIPRKEMIFSHLAGEIRGFGKQIQRFDQWQQHHVKDIDSKKEYDFSIYGIVKFFQLCMDNNPNMIDLLFVPRRCVLFTTKIGEMVRENRKLFLTKNSWHKFKGYAYNQIHKMKTKVPTGKRTEIIEKFGYDVKFGYHCIRLISEVAQILEEHDLDLEKNREQLKSVRRGEWSMEDIIDYFNKREKELETLYLNSTLRHSPDEPRIKQLLIDCLEEYYGDLSTAIIIPGKLTNLVNDLGDLVEKYKKV